ncbi:hypothetical protein KBAD11_02070 [Aeromonas dhakensis]|nr:hypothetical protein KBAD45_02070 [Aeromonas dhakensis]CAD7493899.1 hypothetical protein KBAD59_02080 [Aeromonas dhakensis]CAD7494002.1 hypothetical protein KBAD11_02070 [Aeromonas dhakensis]CAD7496596.1 hypothetical protein KBAD14_KBAD14_02080 [Aeromonas dhakensis]CAD7496666.1 hypothetical protein KBAD10_02080 [Aeromonas dhakensis]
MLAGCVVVVLSGGVVTKGPGAAQARQEKSSPHRAVIRLVIESFRISVMAAII